jgi:RimJ/RimL family protein N-acetyltransferase
VTESASLSPAELTFPDPPLTDGVVTLRRLVAADDEAVARACADSETQRWLDFLPRPYLIAHAQAFIALAATDWTTGRAAVFAIADASTSTLLGAVAIQEALGRHPFIGYWVAPWARGRGVATRATVLASRWALRELHVTRLELHAEPGNVASLRVAERAGFQREGIMRNFVMSRDGPVDGVVFSLVPSDIAAEG